MFSDGRVVIATDSGEYRVANTQEAHQYYASLLPQERKDGGVLAGLKFDKEAGCIRAKYAYKNNGETILKSFKKVLAQINKEPVDSIQDSSKPKPDPKVPRKPEVGFKQHDGEQPTEVRNKKYKPGEEQDHTDVVPRSKKDSGLKGSGSTDFEGVGTTDSGNPDTYVQEYQDNVDPTPAGKEMNHAVAESGSTKIKLSNKVSVDDENPLEGIFDRDNSDSLKVAEKDDEDDDKSDKKEDKKNNMPPWLKKENDDDEKDDDGDDDKKESSSDSDKKALASKEAEQSSINTDDYERLKVELNRYKVREARTNEAIKYALASLHVEPERFGSPDEFVRRVTESTKLPVQAIENLTESMVSMASKKREIIEAGKKAQQVTANNESDSGLDFAFTENKFASVKDDFLNYDGTNDLAEAIKGNTRLGKMAKEYETYEPHTKP